MSHDCHCGKPIQDTANLCPPCVETMRVGLHKIADRWAELEDALSWREVVVGEKGKVKNGMVSVGTSINEQAMTARRKATDAVWFALQAVRDDHDATRTAFTPPRLTGTRSQDQTPHVARWLAVWQLAHISHRTNPDTATEIATDIQKAEKATYNATHPTGAHWASVNLACDEHGTSEQGERVPCTGSMWAYVGKDVMPDLVCDVDSTHTVEPKVWERAGWKRRLAGPLDPKGMASLAAKLAGA